MKTSIYKSMAISVLLLFAVMSCAQKNDPSKSSTSKKVESITVQKQLDTHIVVYYFLTNQRCKSCIYLENTTKASLDKNFADELKNGNIVFKTSMNLRINFINEYGLYTNLAIVSD
jgi:hypothetical protein